MFRTALPAQLAAALLVGLLLASGACDTAAASVDAATLPSAATAMPHRQAAAPAPGSVGGCREVPKSEAHSMLAALSDFAGLDSATNNRIAALLPRPLHRALFTR